MISCGDTLKRHRVDREVVTVTVVACKLVGAVGGENEKLCLLWSHLDMVYLAVVHCEVQEKSKLVEIRGSQGRVICLAYGRDGVWTNGRFWHN